MRPLRQFLLHVFVNADVSRHSLNVRFHLLILGKQLLCLLRLILQLNRQLRILKHRESSGGLQLLIIQRQQARFGLLDLLEHFPAQLFCRLQLFPVFLVHLLDPVFALSFQVYFKLSYLLKHVGFLVQELFDLCFVLLECCDCVVFLLDYVLVLFALQPQVFLESLFLIFYLFMQQLYLQLQLFRGVSGFSPVLFAAGSFFAVEFFCLLQLFL